MIDWLAAPRRRGGRPRLRLPARRAARGARRRRARRRRGSATSPSPSRAGTAGAIKFAADAARETRFLALNGDVLTDLDLTALMRAHERARGAGDARPLPGRGRHRLRPGQPRRRRRGARVPREAGRRRRPGARSTPATYVLERSVLDLIPAGRDVSIEREVFPRLVGDGLYGVRLEGYWMDIGTPRALPAGELGHPRGSGSRPRSQPDRPRASSSLPAPRSPAAPTSVPAP